MNSLKSIEITLPSSIYYADPHAAVRSILGNDVSIVDLTVLDVILPNESILIKATFNTVDFNAFKLYKVLETKILNQQSKKYVATKVTDSLTGEEINVIINLNEIPTKKEFYILIKYFQNMSSTDVKYYGTEVNLSNFKQGYISIFDSSYLSYHGNSLEVPKVKEIPVLEKVDAKYETSVFKSLLKIKNSNFTSSCLDISYIHKALGLSSKLNAFDVCSISDCLKNNPEICLICLNNPDELDKLVGTNSVLIICANRKHLLTVILISDPSTVLTQNAINNAKLILNYDLYNYNLLIKE